MENANTSIPLEEEVLILLFLNIVIHLSSMRNNAGVQDMSYVLLKLILFLFSSYYEYYVSEVTGYCACDLSPFERILRG